MGLKKLEVTLLLILLQFLLPDDQDAYPSTSAAATTYTTDFIQGPNATVDSKLGAEELTGSKRVDIGGSRIGEGLAIGHPNSLIPMFVPHHGQNNQHYRNSSSQGNGSTVDLPNLLLVLLLVVYLFDMFA